MDDNKFIVLTSIFFVMFIFGMGSLLVEKPLSNFLNAATANVSADKSFLTISPQVCSLSNTPPNSCPDQKVKVAVFIRNDKTDLLPKKTVKLSTDLASVIINPSDTQITDGGGKAEFSLTSTSVGTANLTVQEVSNNNNPITIHNTLSAEFTP